MGIPILGDIIASIGSIIEKAVPDADAKAKLQAEITSELIKYNTEIAQAQASIIIAEAKGQSWMQRNWRPTLMMVLVTVVANNYILFPLFNVFFPEYVKVLELPDGLWDLMFIGVGGYIAGRSGEKIIANSKWAKNNGAE
jgi:hypothetical protein